MNFNSVTFLLIYLPIVWLVFSCLGKSYRVPFLFTASLVFYGASGWVPLIFLIGTIIWTYLIALTVIKYGDNRFVLPVAVTPPLLVLFLFKYLGFTTSIFVTPPPDNNVFSFFIQYILPAGISFYTFQAVSYIIDVKDGQVEADRNFLRFGCFISFFPQLIAGPILRFSQINEQLSMLSSTEKLRPDYARALKFLAVGLFYKAFFADILRALQEAHGLSYGETSLDALFYVLSYTFIIYYDFWGYSLMAIGIAMLFSINLPRNFLEPYRSFSPKEFWRRWHVTLSYWLRDYLYIRLGGNQAYGRNIVIVFLATGIWHGAGWGFVLWGCYHALIVLIYHFTRNIWDRAPAPVGIALTFTLVTLGWPLFFMDLGGYGQLMGVLFSGTVPATPLFGGKFWIYLGGVAAWTFLFREDRWLFSEGGRQVLESPFVQALLFAGSIMMLDFSRTFIYFQF